MNGQASTLLALTTEYRATIIATLDANRRDGVDGVDLCHACGVDEAEMDMLKCEAYGAALEGLETEGVVLWRDAAWHLRTPADAHLYIRS
jgi:hypothetical protein